MDKFLMNPLVRLKSHRDLIAEKCQNEYIALSSAMLNGYDIENANSIYSRLCELSHTKFVLSEVTNELASKQCKDPVFLVGSEILYRAFRKLCSISTESILYAGGNCYNNYYTIERLIDLKLDKSEIGYASANDSFVSKSLIELEKYGSQLSCYFHAHPGNGINSNIPSSIDISNQERLERGGYNTIGVIFSRDGFLRIFSDKLKYRISISGKGVDCVAENVFKLTELS